MSMEPTKKIKLSEKVNKALDSIFPSEDIFSTSKFSTDRYINKLFPNEDSLSRVDEILVIVQKKISSVQGDLHKSIREQSLSESETINLEGSKSTIKSLFSKIDSIQKKANESENLVEQITKDIQKLDEAKKNLQLTISTLRKLEMFVSSISELKGFIKKKDYFNVSKKLRAINSFIIFFQKYYKIKKIQELFLQVAKLKDFLSKQITKEFKMLTVVLKKLSDDINQSINTTLTLSNGKGANPNTIKKTKEMIEFDKKRKRLKSICLVIDGLSDNSESFLQLLLDTPPNTPKNISIRDKMINDFVKEDMKIYKSTFSKSMNIGLSKVWKRYKFIRKLLNYHKKVYGKIFPPQWGIEQEIVINFCIITFTDIQGYLNDQNGEMVNIKDKDNNAVVLIRAIKSTTNFEREMHVKYHKETDWELEKKETKLLSEMEMLKKKKQKLKLNSSQNVSEIYKLIKRIRELERLQDDRKRRKEQTDNKSNEKNYKMAEKSNYKNYHFLGLVSKVFEGHMNIYISAESKNMTSKIKQIIKNERWDPNSSHHSGEDLFIYIEDSLKNCVSFSKGKTLLDLYKFVWKKHILMFITMLKERIPKIRDNNNSSGGGGNLPFKLSLISIGGGGGSSNYRTISDNDIKRVCHIINLCNYCRIELDSTKKLLLNNILQNYKREISFKEEITMFYSLEKKGIKTIVKNLVNLCINNGINQIPKIANSYPASSGNDEDDGMGSIPTNPNEYVTKLCKIIQTNIEKFSKFISWESFKMFLNQFVCDIKDAYIFFIYKCTKGISYQCCAQFKMDVEWIRSFLKTAIKCHSEFEDNDEYEKIFVKKVNDDFNNVTNIFYVIMSKNENVLEIYKKLYPKNVRSKEHFEKLINLKNVSKDDNDGSSTDEKATLMEKFLSKTRSLGEKIVKKKK